MRFSGKVGFGKSVESPPGSKKWKTEITERTYSGDVVRNAKNAQEAEGVNDRLAVSHSISIVSDSHAVEHLNMIKYVEWDGVRWQVTSVERRRPRLVLQLGGVYNGPTP